MVSSATSATRSRREATPTSAASGATPAGAAGRATRPPPAPPPPPPPPHRARGLTRDLGKEERGWPYDEGLVGEARQRLDAVVGALDDIHDVNDHGIRTRMDAHRWGGQTFHASGWNPRHIEGVEHFFFYNLEKRTGRHFIHGQPVGLGIVLGSVMHGVGGGERAGALARAGAGTGPRHSAG